MIRKTTRIGLSLFLLAVLLGGALSLNSTQTALAAPSVTATAVSAGLADACALTSDGRVECWGYNGYGNLGNGTTTSSSTPVIVSGISGATAISSGTYHNCAVDAGAAKCWGWNSSGQLGDGTTTNQSVPVTVSGLSSGVVAVSAGGFFSCALMSTGTVKCWGTNVEGQLGNGTTTSSLTPVDVSGLSGVVAIASGQLHTCALTSGGAVLCWGYNGTGALGNGTTTDSYVPTGVSGLGSGVTAISAGERNNCALTSGGAVKCWGYGGFGELGNGSNSSSSVPVNVVGLSSGVSAIGAGSEHACAVIGGIAKCWGFNGSGQLGDGTNTNSNVPVTVSNLTNVSQLGVGYSTCAVTTDGAVYCWGLNSSGQLGNGTTTDSNVPVSVTLISVQCPAGQYDDGSGCVDAPAGSYVPAPGATSAIPCPVGTYQDQTGQDSCKLAPAGSYVSTTGATSATFCPVGKYQPLSGSTSCDPAEPGHFLDTVGSAAQTACAEGYYQPSYGSTSCIAATSGYYVDTTGAIEQTLCPDGYTSDAGASSCYPINTPPSVDAGGSYSGNEGSAIAMSGATATDPDTGDTLTYAWSVDSPLCSFDDASALDPNLTCSDNGSYTATLSVDDGVNPAVTSDASVTVNNVAPTLGAISVNAELVPVGTAVTASADFTDPGTLDTHTATWDWGDNTSSAGTVTESAGSGSVSDSHSYSAAGVYEVKLTVTDKDGGVSNESIYQYVVVYDPSAGFVTGGGWIDSQAGAYMADPSLTGKATFGFVSKYKKGASVPTGNTEFQFQAGDFNFHSDTYDWLVVNQAGTNAQFKGSGTVNGALDNNGNAYKFQLWAGDGSPDTFRIKIWSEDASGVETVVYDNGFDQAIGGGSIVVHSK